ncbi:tigger transposable element-derived protein 6-like [Pecten maximus]|uniref:tigger transposable element-derived protein 6-like n=1 Tax=Pecten maximus TaxID=6579 RepID=UPI00145853B2|nr:tigger transposable element-derived protein 6-like [Pecten maximus]
MTSEMHISWVRDLDRKFARENRKVLLFIDNCPAHTVVNNLKSIEIRFLPPNSISFLQPMDQGIIINNFNVFYRELLIQAMLKAMDKKKHKFVVDLASAINWIYRACGLQACFGKVGFKSDPAEVIIEIDQSDDILDDMPLSDLRRVLLDTPLTEYIEVDSQLTSRKTFTTDKDIVRDLTDTDVNQDSSQESDIDDDPVRIRETATSAVDRGHKIKRLYHSFKRNRNTKETSNNRQRRRRQKHNNRFRGGDGKS